MSMGRHQLIRMNRVLGKQGHQALPGLVGTAHAHIQPDLLHHQLVHRKLNGTAEQPQLPDLPTSAADINGGFEGGHSA